MTGTLSGKVAVVTGGNGGIGLGMARGIALALVLRVGVFFSLGVGQRFAAMLMAMYA